ncbi:MAG: MFS transporter [Lentisphaeria bacterium]|nr:MFS transporter [Lentisphaeria bacterium]
MMEPGGDKPLYRCGTLTYTRLGLLNLFIWLLWGDFCFSMMETVSPSLTPLLLKMHNASNLTIGVLMGSIPALLNFIINPIVSTRSDRTRSRWGRRIPYLLFTPPFTALFLILLGWSDQISAFFYGLLWGDGGNPATFTICLIAFFVICYQGFDLFVGSVFYYIFADVVPQQFIGRFMSLFRIAGTLAGMCFNLLVMPYAKTHMSIIFTVIALIYVLSFTGMCLHVKEGKYPPPSPAPPGLPAMIRGYFRDCFSVPFFAILFIGLAFNYVSTVCRGMFNLLFALNDLGLSTAQFGRVGAVGGIVSVVLYLPMGYLVDRFHPLRIYLAGALLVTLVNPFGFFFVHGYGTFMAMGILLAVVYTVQNSSLLPLCVKLYPKEQFGQFCSAAAMVKALLLVAANAAGGWFIDLLGYRWLYVWDFFFTIICFAILLWIYFRWKRLGGDTGYRPPLRSGKQEA